MVNITLVDKSPTKYLKKKLFVLLPGASFTMGAQSKDKDGANYDPQADRFEAPHRVTLAPFFLARHELTQGQWRRLGGKRLGLDEAQAT